MLGLSPLGSTPLGSGGKTYIPDYYEDVSVFVPLEIRATIEKDYLESHLKAFRDNQNSNNDYSLLALHQIFMFLVYGFLYSCLRRDSVDASTIFAMAPVRKEEKEQLTRMDSLFVLSFLKERSVFALMEVFGCDMSNGIDKLKKLVDGRNYLSHCNGQTCVNFENDINGYIEGLEVLHAKFAPVITDHMRDINSIDFGVTKDGQLDQLKTIMSNNCISQRMVELATPPTGKGGLTKRSHKLLMSYLANEI